MAGKRDRSTFPSLETASFRSIEVELLEKRACDPILIHTMCTKICKLMHLHASYLREMQSQRDIYPIRDFWSHEVTIGASNVYF